MFKPLLSLLALGLFAGAALAQQVELEPDHPESYVVKRGDTLWDISSRFLRDPWLWPEIWETNPQIENPHLIYPGDVVQLSFVGGEPRLSVRRGERPTVRLSPGIRRSSLADAVAPIDLDDIRPFLDNRTILSREELDGIPYVVDIQEGYLAGTQGARIYVRNLDDARPGEAYAVVKPTVVFREVPTTFPYDKAEEFRPVSEEWEFPAEKSLGDYLDDFWDNVVIGQYTRNVITRGYEVRQAGIAEVVGSGDPSTLLLTSSSIEIQPGDLVIPVFSANLDLEYVPHAATQVGDGAHVIGLSKALFGAGRHQVVAINRGWVDGMEHGHVLSIHRPSREIRDEVRYPRDDVQTFFSRTRRREARVEIPEEYAGHLLVFKTFENVSYGLIVRAVQAVKLGDVLREP